MKALPVTLFTLYVCAVSATAQPPEITGYDQDGTLTFQSSSPGKSFTLEFAPGPAGPWTNWGTVSDQPITGQVMQLPTPMFYRIAERDPGDVTDPGFRAYLTGQGFDRDGDGRITKTECGWLTSWRAQGGYPTNVTMMDAVRGFDVFDMSVFINATYVIDTGNCGASTAIFRSMPNLTSVTLQWFPELTNVVLRSLPVLQVLDFKDCTSLETLDISSLSHLRTLSVASCPEFKEVVVWWDTQSPPPIGLSLPAGTVLRNP